jgi:formylglycine-generating enzyme required for sulfatase activity
LFAVTLALGATVMGATACTRDDVATAVATIAVQLEATLEPWGATVAANAQAQETRIPSVLATAKAPASPTAGMSPTSDPGLNASVAAVSTGQTAATATPATEPTGDPATSTPPPTATPLPTATATIPPTATATPTATSIPTVIDVSGGSMTLISGGTFQMGAPAAALADECSVFRDGCQTDWFAASEPVHEVLLGRYYIDNHEVTNEAFAAFLNTTDPTDCAGYPCIDPAQSQIAVQNGDFGVEDGQALLPASGITWYGASAYCAWREARLPTEAEWERAAAWDAETDVARRYPWGDEFIGSAVNFCDANCDAPQANVDQNDGFAEVAPVASFAAGVSPAGLYDMAGNVWEWVADWYDPTYYAQSPGANPTGPDQGEVKVVRGGSWFDTGNFTAAAIRFPSAPDNADRTIGFRCAADVP